MKILVMDNYKDRVSLSYYVPKDRSQDADRTFKDTPKMMEFFETYFGIDYHTANTLRL